MTSLPCVCSRSPQCWFLHSLQLPIFRERIDGRIWLLHITRQCNYYTEKDTRNSGLLRYLCIPSQNSAWGSHKVTFSTEHKKKFLQKDWGTVARRSWTVPSFTNKSAWPCWLLWLNRVRSLPLPCSGSQASALQPETMMLLREIQSSMSGHFSPPLPSTLSHQTSRRSNKEERVT